MDSYIRNLCSRTLRGQLNWTDSRTSRSNRGVSTKDFQIKSSLKRFLRRSSKNSRIKQLPRRRWRMLSKTLHLFQSLHSRGRGLTSKVPPIYYSTRGFTNKLRMIKSINTNYCRNRNRSEPSIMTFQLVKGKYKETNPTNILLFEAITQN